MGGGGGGGVGDPPNKLGDALFFFKMHILVSVQVIRASHAKLVSILKLHYIAFKLLGLASKQIGVKAYQLQFLSAGTSRNMN